MTRKQCATDELNAITQLLGEADDEDNFDGFGKRRRGSSDPLVQLITEEEPPSKRQKTS